MVISPLAAQHQFDACCGSFGTSIVATSGGLQQADKVPKAKSPQIIYALFIAATSSEFKHVRRKSSSAGAAWSRTSRYRYRRNDGEPNLIPVIH
jgi:hypothetical protein